MIEDKRSDLLSSSKNVLSEVNQALIWLMINHPYYNSREIAELNSKVALKIREIKEHIDGV